MLISWENEAYLATKELGPDKFEIVTPTLSILAEPSVTVVDKVVDKRGTRKVAEAYLNYLYSAEGQDIAGKHYYRPRDAKAAEKYKAQFSAREALHHRRGVRRLDQGAGRPLQGRRRLRPDLRQEELTPHQHSDAAPLSPQTSCPGGAAFRDWEFRRFA